jgi:glycosyltransferase involved in cell wall biosynthesis
MTTRLAIVVSHPIQHFAPWHQEVAKIPGVDLRVLFCCDWGTVPYFDPEFCSEIRWDIPLLDGYSHGFLPIKKRPQRLGYRQVDNPTVGEELDRFNPDVVKVFGYAYKTNWRAARWASRRRKPLLLYSDSNGRAETPPWKRFVKHAVVGRFYSQVDGALFVGDNNLAYHRRYGLAEDRLFPGSMPIHQSQLIRSIPDRMAMRSQIREEYGIPSEAFVVMFCGKYSSYKRPIDVIAAAHMVSQVGIPTWSILVGEGSERGRLEEYIRHQHVRNTTLTGFINQSRIPAFYAAADALIVSSERDSHPLVVSEAGTFGLPAIVSDLVGCIGPNDTAQPGVNALIYPCGNRQKLGEAIRQLYREKDQYRLMSLRAEEIAATQDVTQAAKQLATAAQQLHLLGPR